MMNIDELEAGRATDALIAEWVMGYTVEQVRLMTWPATRIEALQWGWLDYDEERDCDISYKRRAKVGGYYGPSMIRPEQWDYFRLPMYSTKITAAWEIIEHLKPQDYGWFLLEEIGHITDTSWAASWHGKEKYKTGIARTVPLAIWTDTAPLAICRAALKVVGAT